MAFVPSAGFFDVSSKQPPGHFEGKTETRKKLARPPVVNKIRPVEGKKEEKALPEDFNPSLFYQSVIVKTLKEPEIIEKEEIVLDCPLLEDEIVKDPALDVALNQNFTKVPERALSVVSGKKKKLKYGENFVRANLSRSKSNKKMGKTLCPKRKFKYFNSVHLEVREGKKVVFSEGFHNKVRSESTELSEILREEFKFDRWKNGQLESIESVLEGKNTLTVLPTGQGKSLVFQMASRVLGGLTVVISPLISLITDQIMRLPLCLSAAALVSGLEYSQYQQIIKAAQQGRLDILYVTPERFISESIYQIQNIKLVCIDEAHCISRFSTSSRFSYMILPKFLNTLQILALTGSIDKQSQDDAQALLNIQKVVKCGKAFRKNLQVTVSREDDILTFAGKICRSEKFNKGSLIFYCNLQYMTDSVAQWLRSKGETCQSYHSGLSELRRQQVQEDFTSGKVRILVATVSFGMGIDKSNVVAVIHLHLPSSLEQFIQESGRAGRNGEEAKVHVLVNDSTLYYQRSLIYSNHINKRHILSFGKVLHPNLKRSRNSDDSSEFLYIQISDFLQDLGVNKETLLAILNFFEARGLITNVSISPLNANISFHKTSPEELSKKFAIISHVLTTGKKLATARRVFLPELAKKVGISVKDTVKVLKRLAATGEINSEFMDDGFELTCLSFPVELELLKLAEEAEEFFKKTEEVLRAKIETCFMVFDKVAEDSFQQCQDVFEELADLIEEYIQGNLTEELPGVKVNDIKNDVVCVATQFDGVPDAKDVTCVLQGINTERTPYSRWKNYYLWSRYRKSRFLDVYQKVAEALMEGIEEKVSTVESFKEIVEDYD